MRSHHGRPTTVASRDPRSPHGRSAASAWSSCWSPSSSPASSSPRWSPSSRTRSAARQRTKSASIPETRSPRTASSRCGSSTTPTSRPRTSTTAQPHGRIRSATAASAPSYTLVGENRPYTVTYEVTPHGRRRPEVRQGAASSRADSGFVTTAQHDHQGSHRGHLVGDRRLSRQTSLITVYFDNYVLRESPGVCIRRVRTECRLPTRRRRQHQVAPWPSSAPLRSSVRASSEVPTTPTPSCATAARPTT